MMTSSPSFSSSPSIVSRQSSSSSMSKTSSSSEHSAHQMMMSQRASRTGSAEDLVDQCLEITRKNLVWIINNNMERKNNDDDTVPKAMYMDLRRQTSRANMAMDNAKKETSLKAKELANVQQQADVDKRDLMGRCQWTDHARQTAEKEIRVQKDAHDEASAAMAKELDKLRRELEAEKAKSATMMERIHVLETSTEQQAGSNAVVRQPDLAENQIDVLLQNKPTLSPHGRALVALPDKENTTPGLFRKSNTRVRTPLGAISTPMHQGNLGVPVASPGHLLRDDKDVVSKVLWAGKATGEEKRGKSRAGVAAPEHEDTQAPVPKRSSMSGELTAPRISGAAKRGQIGGRSIPNTTATAKGRTQQRTSVVTRASTANSGGPARGTRSQAKRPVRSQMVF